MSSRRMVYFRDLMFRLTKGPPEPKTIGFGLLPDPEEQVAMAAWPLPEVPAAALYARVARYWDTTRILDQGASPQCVGFSWAQLLLMDPIQQWHEPTLIYRESQKIAGLSVTVRGSYINAGAKYLHSMLKLKHWRWASDADHAMQWVAAKGPVVCATDWYAGMRYVDRQGFMELSGATLGRHAYVLSGVDWDKDRVRVTNSWGDEWGFGGHAYLHIEDFQSLMRNSGRAIAATES